MTIFYDYVCVCMSVCINSFGFLFVLTNSYNSNNNIYNNSDDVYMDDNRSKSFQ